MKQLFLILCIVPLLLACSSDDKGDADYSDLIVGTWDVVYAVGHETGKDGHVYDEWDGPTDNNMYYTFFENNKGREYYINRYSGGMKIEETQLEWYILDRKLIIKENPGEKNERTTSQDIKELTNDKMVLYYLSNTFEIMENTRTLKKRK